MNTTDKPRTRNASETRGRILAAAQAAFAQVGYSAAGIRAIAAAATIDPALVMRYYGSKAGLYEAALIDAIPDYPGLDLSHARFGERLAAKFIEAFLDDRALSMMILSAGDPEAQAISLKVMQEHGVAPLARWLGPPDAEARAKRMLMLSTGFKFYTRQLPIMSATDATESQTTEWLARALQEIVDEGGR